MEATKMHVMLDIKDEFKRVGMDNADVADATHKDKSTVDKQFAEKNGTQSLITAYGYAEAAGGRVVFMLDKDWDRYKSIEQELVDINDILRDREQRLANMSETVKSLSSQVEAQRKMIERLEGMIDKKEEAIARKDAAIASMLRKSGAIE